MTTPWAASSRPSAATSTPALISSSLKRPMVSSISSNGVSIIFVVVSSVPRMISMYLVISTPLSTGPVDLLTHWSNGPAADRHDTRRIFHGLVRRHVRERGGLLREGERREALAEAGQDPAAEAGRVVAAGTQQGPQPGRDQVRQPGRGRSDRR